MVTDTGHRALAVAHQRLRERNAALEHERDKLRRQLFRRQLSGRRSERFAPAPDQRGLFDPDPSLEADEGEAGGGGFANAGGDPGDEPRPSPPGRNPPPAHFPVETEVIVPELIADGTAFDADDLERDGYDLLGFETSRRVAYRAAEYRIVERKRPRYRNRATGVITVAHAGPRVLARSRADESLATDIILEKYVDHLPLYRQAAILRREHDWDLSRATLGEVVERVAVALRPLYDALARRILATGYVQMDESGIRVQSGDKPGATHRG